MTKPLVVFTGAALATLAALLGVTADKWKVQPVSATGVQLSTGSADAAPSPAATVAAAKQDAASPGSSGTGPVDAGTSIETASVSTEPPAAVAPKPPAAPELVADDSKPSFDTIRVEPDGTAVIAGRGLPDSEVAILFNDQPIGSAKTDPAGAWVLVPTEPLPVGDYQVTLRMQQPNAPPVFSEQSVALKVPERGAEEAMIVLSEHNQPSRVLQQPQTAVAEPVEESQPVAAPEPAGASSGEDAVAVVPPDASATAKVAALAPDATAAAEPAPPAPQSLAKLPLNLGTVDYNDQGDIIFSGTVTGGATVRLYVDNHHVGDAMAERGGRWQFAGRENIKPGTHNLRVDKLHRGGSVAERIELPFVRAEPVAVAALIEQQPAPASAEPAPASAAGASTAGEAAGAAVKAQKPAASAAAPAPAETAEIPTASKASEAAAAEPPAAAPAAEEIAAVPAQTPAVVTEAEVGGTAAEPPEPAPAAAEEAAAAVAQEAPAASQAEVADTAAEPPDAPPAAEEAEAAAPAQNPSGEAPQATASAVPVATTSGAASSPQIASPGSETLAAPAAADQVAPTTGSPAEAASPPPGGAAAVAAGAAQPEAGQPRNGRVVIQPGNNLWRISRVIYGQGVQYTIIYQANKEQIRSPDLIYPGQIFATPGVVAPEVIDPKQKEPLPGVAGSTTSG